jgi:hypothetical protein
VVRQRPPNLLNYAGNSASTELPGLARCEEQYCPLGSMMGNRQTDGMPTTLD